MSDNKNDFTSTALVIPAFGKSPALSLDMNSTREAEKRYVEAKTVNPVTYVDLEHTFNESYRELKRHHATIGYQIVLADKALKEAKANVILGTYADFVKENKKQDNADTREAFLMRDEAYSKALDRLAQLKAIEAFIDGRIKVTENVCRYMRKEMDLILRSGLTGKDLYLNGGKK